MPFLADDPWANADAPVLADDPWKNADPPEVGADVMWAGRPMSMNAIRLAAEQNKTTPAAIMRLGTLPGQIESRLAYTAAGSLAIRFTEGVTGVGKELGAFAARAVGRGDISARIHEDRRQRQEFLSLIEKGGEIEEALGPRAARVFNQTSQSLGEIGTVGTLTGPTGIYSYVTGSAWENGLDDGERAGLQGADLIGHAGRQAVLEGGITFLMGKTAAKMGIATLEESFSPAMRSAANKFLSSPGMREKMKTAAKELGGWTSEGVEEMLVSGGQQLNEISSDMRPGFAWDEILEAGASGVFGRGAVGAVRGLKSELEGFEKNIPGVVEGVRAAEIDMERGLNPFEVRDITDAAELDRQTGHKFGSDTARDSYRDALDFYIKEAHDRGETGGLVRMEEDVRKLREEERQRSQRIVDSKAKAALNKGKTGESQVSIEPVEEQPLLTANERAPFKISEFEAAVDPESAKMIEALTQPPAKINPYILAPWESETRPQRRIRIQSRQLAENKDTIAGLRQAIVDNKRLTKEQQNAAFDLVRENIPTSEQHGFFRGVLDAARPSAVNRLLNRVAGHVEKRDHRQAVGGLKESFRKATNLRREFAEQVKEIRSSVDLKRFRGAEVAESLRAWASENPAAVLSEGQKTLLDRLNAQNVSGMSADDIRGLSDFVERLAYASAAQDRLIGNQRSASLRDTGDSIAKSIDAAPRKEMKSDSFVRQAKADLTGAGLDESLDQDRTLASQLFHEIAERPEATLLQLSPELSAALYDPLRAARDTFQMRVAATSELFSSTLDKVGLEHGDSLSASIAYRFGLPNSTKLEGWREKVRTIGGNKITRGQAWWVALSSYDPAAMKNLMEVGVTRGGKQLLPPVIPMMLKDVFDFIGPEGRTLAAVAFEHLNTYVIDGLNDPIEKATGRPLTDKKNVVPMFKADNEYVQLSTKGRSFAGMQDAVVDSYSHLQHREGGSFAIDIPVGMDGIDMFMRHAERMHRVAAYMLPARNAEMILNDGPVKAAIKEKNGEQGYDAIADAVRSEVAGYTAADKVSKGLSAWNHAAAGALVGGKLSVMLSQPLDLLAANAYGEHDYGDLLTGMNKELAAKGPVEIIKEMSRVLGANSGEWNHRYKSGDYAVEVTNGMFQKRGYFHPSSLVDHAADVLQKSELISVAMPNYLAAKAAARRQLGIDPNDFEPYENDPGWVNIVNNEWGRKIVRGSNSSHGLELSASLRWAKKNPLAGLVLNFYNQAGKVYSLFPMAQNALGRGDMQAAGRFAAAGVASTLMFAALQTALSTGERDKEKYEFWQRWMIRSVKNTVGLHPAAAQVVTEEVINKALGLPAFEDNPVLLSGLIGQLGISGVKLAQMMLADADATEDPEAVYKAWMEFGRSAGPLLGIPTVAPIDLKQRIDAGTLFPGLQEVEQDDAPAVPDYSLSL